MRQIDRAEGGKQQNKRRAKEGKCSFGRVKTRNTSHGGAQRIWGKETGEATVAAILRYVFTAKAMKSTRHAAPSVGPVGAAEQTNACIEGV